MSLTGVSVDVGGQLRSGARQTLFVATPNRLLLHFSVLYSAAHAIASLPHAESVPRMRFFESRNAKMSPVGHQTLYDAILSYLRSANVMSF